MSFQAPLFLLGLVSIPLVLLALWAARKRGDAPVTYLVFEDFAGATENCRRTRFPDADIDARNLRIIEPFDDREGGLAPPDTALREACHVLAESRWGALVGNDQARCER